MISRSRFWVGITTEALTMLFKVRRGVWVISVDAFSSSRFHSMAASFFSIGNAYFSFFWLMAFGPPNLYLLYCYIGCLFLQKQCSRNRHIQLMKYSFIHFI